MERFRWDLGQELHGDRAIVREGDALDGRRIALLACGGIAAYRAPDLIRGLRRQGAEVQVYMTEAARHFVTPDVLEWSSLNPVIDRLDGRAQHVEDARDVDMYLVAPATYSTINKMAFGLADNAVTTTMAAAIGRMQDGRARIQVVPTMHGDMVNDILRESLAKLADLGVEVVPPRPGAGKANIPETEALVAGVIRGLAGHRGRPDLRGKRVLVTGGPTPVPIDAVRQLTNRFSGRTAIGIATAFHRAGAEVELLLSGSNVPVPSWLPTTRVATYEAYKAACLERSVDLGIFSAAVADYAPSDVHDGKLPSRQAELNISLKPTEKVVERWRSAHPEATLISFKLEAGLSDEALQRVAEGALARHSDLVVANHARGGELMLVSEEGCSRTERDALGEALVNWAVSGA